MSDLAGRVASLDAAMGTASLSLAAVIALAVLVAVGGLLAFQRSAREDIVGWLSRGVLVVLGAIMAAVIVGGSSNRDLAAERRALEARAVELAARAVAPGSALACLDLAAGEEVAAGCEKALFATAQATAAAVAYVSAQLSLLADMTVIARRDPRYEPWRTPLRRATESDRFGIVAHVLTVREGCLAERCSALALFSDPTRVRLNLLEHTYDQHVRRNAPNWPADAAAPVARGPAPAAPPAAPPSEVAAAPALPLRPPGPNVFFPSSSSIPAVSIMTAEPPTAPASEAGRPGAQRKAAPPAPPAPAVAPQAAVPPIAAAPAAAPRRPADFNVDAARIMPPAPLAPD